MLGKAATWLLYASLAFTMVTRHGTAWPLVALLGRLRARGRLARRATRARRGQRSQHEGRRHGRRRGHAPAAADLEPAEADGADRRQAVHGAHPRAAARPRLRRTSSITRRLPAAGDPQPLRRRLELGLHIEYSVEETPLGTAGSVRLASGRLDEHDADHLRRRALRHRPDASSSSSTARRARP